MPAARFIRYVEGNSPVHRLDPRAKLTFIFFLILSLTLASSLIQVLPLLIVSLLFYFSARLPWEKTRGTWAFILAALIVLSAMNYLTVAALYGGEGESLASRLTSPETVLRAVIPVIKLLSLAAATATLVFTTPPNMYAPALGQMGLSYGKAYVIQLALRYVPEFVAELRKTLEAQMARGFRPRGGKNPISRLLAIVPLVVPVTVSAALSIYDIADAMELRGFGGEECHTWYRKLRMSKLDKALVAGSVALGATYVALQVLETLNLI